MSTTAVIYANIVDDVVQKLKPQFQSEGVDDNVLKELQELWESKIVQSGAVQGRMERMPVRQQNATVAVHDLNVPYEATEEFQTPTAEILFPPTPIQTPSMATPLIGMEAAMYQYIPHGPNDFSSMPDPGIGMNVKLGRTVPFMQQPSAWINQRPLGVDVNVAYEEGRENEDTNLRQQPMTKDFFTLPSGKRKREDFPSNYLHNGFIPQQDGAGDYHVEFPQSKEAMFNLYLKQGTRKNIPNPISTNKGKLENHIPQLDGADDYSVVNLDNNRDSNLPVEQDFLTINNGGKESAHDGYEDDEPPLNEDDDEIDDIEQGGNEPNTTDLVIAQFEKVSRTKSRWKCTLKDGIMHLNQRDILFSKANGEFEF